MSSRFEIRLEGGKAWVTGIRLGKDLWSVTAIDEEGKTVRRINRIQLARFLKWLHADAELIRRVIEGDFEP